jgi:hypothetical protein
MPARDPLFAPWTDASVGEPILVRSTDGRPAYWLAPIEHAGRAIGFVRVSLAGEVAAAGVLYRDVRRAGDAPALVTRLDAETALARAREAVPGSEPIGDAVYVHDGPPGREAWMVRLRDPDRATRVVFVTPGGTYERDPAGAPRADRE